MNTLYVSDLDGTLLNENAEISNFTREVLTRLITEENMLFTVATARSPATVMQLLQGIPLRIPLVVLTGSVLYDPVNSSYPYIESFQPETIRSVVELLDRHHISAFVQNISNAYIRVFYKKISSSFEQTFVDRRSGTPYKEFIRTDDYQTSLADGKTTLFTIIDKKEVVDYLLPKCRAIPGVTCYCYREEYGSDHYYLEIFSQNTSKAHAIEKLKERLCVDAVCSFGDNVNDLSMFSISQECYATENAEESAKKAATAVIGSNKQDGVAHFLLKRFSGKF